MGMGKAIGTIEGRGIVLTVQSVELETTSLAGEIKTAILLISYTLVVRGFAGSAKIDSGLFMSSLMELVGDEIKDSPPLTAPGLAGSWEIDLTRKSVVSEIPGSMRLEVVLKEISPASA